MQHALSCFTKQMAFLDKGIIWHKLHDVLRTVFLLFFFLILDDR